MMEESKKERVEKFKRLCEEYKERKEKERKEHPERFVPKYPYELFGVECRDGWKHLYQPIIDYANEHKIPIHQVKEKFGMLRVYLEYYDDTVQQMIRDAEAKSYNTCEICGKYIEKPITENYWIYAECQECNDKWKKDRQKNMDEAYEKKRIKENLENN